MSHTKDVARGVLGYYNYPGGWRPGGFISSLIGTFEKADVYNFERLRRAFPELGEVLTVVRQEGLQVVSEMYIDREDN